LFEMSVRITEAKAAGFIPVEVIVREALRILRANLKLGMFVRRPDDFGGPIGIGDVISVPYPGTFRAVNKAAGTALSSRRPFGGTKVQLTIDKHPNGRHHC
jgi:hypothetical protein